MEFVSILQELQQLPFELPAESINGIVVVVFTTVAAIISVIFDRRKKKRDRMDGKSDSRDTTHLLERVFDELQKTTEVLRYENQQLMNNNHKLTESIEECQVKYRKQLEDSVALLNDVNAHKRTIDKLNKKIDSLLKAINEVLDEDVKEVIDLEELDIDNS